MTAKATEETVSTPGTGVVILKATLVPFALMILFEFLEDQSGPSEPPWPMIVGVIAPLVAVTVGYIVLSRGIRRNRFWLGVVYFPAMLIGMGVVGTLLGFAMGWVDL